MVKASPNSRIFESPLTRESNAWRLTVENGVHWFVTPSGEKFYGSGVNGVDAGSAPEEVDGRLLINFGISIPQFMVGCHPSAVVLSNGASIISARGIFAWKKSASRILPTSISDA